MGEPSHHEESDQNVLDPVGDILNRLGLDRGGTRARRRLVQGAGLCLLTLLAYLNSFTSGFALDNAFVILGDSRIQRWKQSNLALIFNHGYTWPMRDSYLFRPVTTLTYLFNYAILGNANHPAGYHAINLLIHCINVLLVFALALRLMKQERPALLAAAIWAVHPVLTESVTNIVGRADLLAGMAILGGLLLYLKSAEAPGASRWGWLTALMAITAVGALCKENAVTVSGVIALWEITWWNRRRLPGLVLGLLATAPGILAMWWMRSKALAAEGPPAVLFVDNPIVGLGQRIGHLTAVTVMAKYLELLAWPLNLSADYSFGQIPVALGRAPRDWIAAGLVILTAAVVLWLYRRNKAAFFAATFGFVTLLPMSNLLFPIGTIMAERFLYLPAVGFSICLTLALYHFARRALMKPGAPFLVGALIVTAFAARTWIRNYDWHDEITIWTAAAQTSPLSFKPHMGLAKAILHSGHPDGAQIFHEAKLAMGILDPLPDRLNDADLYYELGGEFILVGDSLQRVYSNLTTEPSVGSIENYQNAETALRRALSIYTSQHRNPDPYLYLMLSQVDSRLGKGAAALTAAREGREAGPMEAAPYMRIHDILLATGKKDEASAALMEGWLLTSDIALRTKLMDGYSANPDESVCALASAGSSGLDASCQMVRGQACSVSAEAIRLAQKAGGQAAAARLKSTLVSTYGCRD